MSTSISNAVVLAQDYMRKFRDTMGNNPPDAMLPVLVKLIIDDIPFAFTGSRAIGGFRENSDWDIVAGADHEYAQLFSDDFNTEDCGYGVHYTAMHVLSVRVLDVNVIFDDRAGDILNKWKAATEEAKRRKAFTREERVKIFVEHGI